MDYQTFIHSKSQLGQNDGFEPLWLPDFLFDFQRSLVEWSVRKGRAAIFADCGLDKGDQKKNALSQWIYRQYASPVWMDIRRERLLPYRQAKEDPEERLVRFQPEALVVVCRDGGKGMAGLVLSLFPGIGLLDRAFEEEGFVVVRGPDVLWGGDIRRFHPPAGRFDGVIGGPPCQAFTSLARPSIATGKKPKFGNLIPEFERCVVESGVQWFVMENVPTAPRPWCPATTCTPTS